MAIVLKPPPPPLSPVHPCRARRPSLHPPQSPLAKVTPSTARATEDGATCCPPDTLPYLPPELHLKIIEAIAERIPSGPNREQFYDPADLATLCACSLVCKLWLSTARARIWAGVRLSGRLRSMAFIDLLEAYVCTCSSMPALCHGKEGIVKLHERACPRARLAIPSFASRILHLSVRETRGNPWDPKWLNDALPYLAAHLMCVRILEMERMTWEYLSTHSRSACLQCFRHARELALRGCFFHTTLDLCEFLAEFDKLEVLTLDGVHCLRSNAPRWYLDAWIDGKKCINPPSGALRAVGVRGAPMDTVLEWIMSGIDYRKGLDGNGTRITSVKLGGVGSLEAEVVGRFLKELGGSLSELRVGFDQDFVESGDPFVDNIDLGQNSRLQELHIFGLVVPSPPPPDPTEHEPEEPPISLTQLTSLLSPIRSPMRVLSLAMYPADIRAMSTVDFQGLVGVFTRTEWARVEEVRVVISNKGECGLGRVVKQNLSCLDERGVLRVNVGFDEREVI
ncbi:hypothetical protein ID866_3390 [Astraeus odoratus]|nr:hypothetical protein ID866_3390 [Astraeus odoratus]